MASSTLRPPSSCRIPATHSSLSAPLSRASRPSLRPSRTPRTAERSRVSCRSARSLASLVTVPTAARLMRRVSSDPRCLGSCVLHASLWCYRVCVLYVLTPSLERDRRRCDRQARVRGRRPRGLQRQQGHCRARVLEVVRDEEARVRRCRHPSWSGEPPDKLCISAHPKLTVADPWPSHRVLPQGRHGRQRRLGGAVRPARHH